MLVFSVVHLSSMLSLTFLCDSDLEMLSSQATRTLTILAWSPLLFCCPTDKCRACLFESGLHAHYILQWRGREMEVTFLCQM